MAERSQDHPGFDWLMHHMDRLITMSPRVWVASDGDDTVVSNVNLGELLASLPPDRGRFAVAYVRPAFWREPPTGGRTPGPERPIGFEPAATRFEPVTDHEQGFVLVDPLKSKNASEA